MNLPGVIHTNPQHVPGCKFCGTKTQTIAANGTVFHHAAVSCCPPSALLQLTRRDQDVRTAGEKYDRANNPSIRADYHELLKDAQKDRLATLDAFQHHITAARSALHLHSIGAQ